MAMKNKLKLVTHDGSFHADDVFACATLSILLERKGESFEVARTRDPEIIETGDYVFDVGGIYDKQLNRFDHHQRGGAGKRENGIEYAGCGLVWKKFGTELCGSQKVADLIDERLFAPIDAGDNGISIMEKKFDTSPYLIQDIFSAISPTWKEKNSNIDIDKVFSKCVIMAKEILSREIVHAKDADLAFQLVTSIYNNTEDKRILVLDKDYPEEVFQNFPETLFVVYPRTDEKWGARAVKDDSGSFKNKKDFPKSWAGLRDNEIAQVSGVENAVFCHRALFLAVAKSKEGAVKLAQIAVES